jgi:hypothetical protein
MLEKEMPRPIQLTEDERDFITRICHSALKEARNQPEPSEETIIFRRTILDKLAYAKRHWE